MKKYSGLGKSNMTFEEAMQELHDNLSKLDPYVMDILFDITMNEEEGEDQNFERIAIHNRS